MSGLSEEIFQEGFKEGYEKGFQEAYEQGVKQGIEKERKRIVQRFLNFGKMTREELSIMFDSHVSEVQN